MVPRYFFALCALVMFVAVASEGVEQAPSITNELLQAKSQNELEENEPQEIANRIFIEKIVQILQNICSIAKNCLKDVTTQCKRYWIKPKLFLQCARQYIRDNYEKCTNPGFAYMYNYQ